MLLTCLLESYLNFNFYILCFFFDLILADGLHIFKKNANIA